MLNADGVQNTTNDPHVITEHFRVISNDEKHDHHFTHYVQNQIAEYLRSISCDVDVMTDVRVGIQVVTVSVIYRIVSRIWLQKNSQKLF